MATGITGRLIRRTTKEPLQGITIEAVNASTGVSASTTTTTDTKGFFEISGLTSAVYFAKPLVPGDDWDLLPNIAEIYTDEIHVADGGSLTIDGTYTGSLSPDAVGIDININSTGSKNVYGIDATVVRNGSGGDATGAFFEGARTDANNMATLRGVQTEALVGGGGGTVTDAIAVDALARSTSAGQTTTNAYGVKGVVSGTAGTIGTARGGYFDVSYGTNQRGVEIQGPSSGANNYAIYSSATAQSEFAGSIKSSSDTGGVGYATGAGGTVTQLTSKATSVTLNKISGQITTHNAALGAATSVVFQLANSTIAATDVVVVHASNNAATDNVYSVEVIMQGAGFANLRLTNVSAGSLSEAVLINFAVIKAVAA